MLNPRIHNQTGQRLPLSKRSRDAISMQKIDGNSFTDAEIEQICRWEDEGLSPKQERDALTTYLFETYGVRQVR